MKKVKGHGLAATELELVKRQGEKSVTNKIHMKKIIKVGYFKDHRSYEETKWWHVTSNGDKPPERDREIEEFRMV